MYEIFRRIVNNVLCVIKCSAHNFVMTRSEGYLSPRGYLILCYILDIYPVTHQFSNRSNPLHTTAELFIEYTVHRFSDILRNTRTTKIYSTTVCHPYF